MLSILEFIIVLLSEQVGGPRWVLFVVCVVGVFFAYTTDGGHSLLSIPDNAHKYHKEVATENSSAKLINMIVFRVSNFILEILPASTIKRLTVIAEKCRKSWTKFQFYRSAAKLKRIATTKRHFSYMLEKTSLSLPIREGETEVESYLDCKTHLQSRGTWPFMWEVSDIRNEKILCNGDRCFTMSSYSYLGLIRDDRVQNAAMDAAKKWSTGSHGPRMLGGNASILPSLEKEVSKFFGRDDTLVCATGYLACMSACAAVATEDSIIFADSRIHASLRAGLKLGDAKIVNFRHNNFEDCENLIKKQRYKFNNAWLVVESVYSMDGDLCDLPSANSLCKRYNIDMLLDEAHGLGVVGETGRGVEEHFGLQGCAKLIVGTFSKSIASIGGYICGDFSYIRYLDFHATGNVFSAPLPAYCAGAAIKSFQLLQENPEMVTQVQKNSKIMRRLLESGADQWPENYPESHKYVLSGDEATSVIPVIFPDDIDRVLRIACRLRKNGFMCSAVGYPACPLRSPRFRLTATKLYTDDLMKDFVKAFVNACLIEPPSDLHLTGAY